MSDSNLEKDIGQTGDFFKYLHTNMKAGMPLWDDFLQKGQRFQRSLEQSVVAFNSFLDGFAKLADQATNSKGATHEIGISLTNMIRWQKALELKIRELNFSLSTKVLTPVGHRLDEWKKQLSNLEKDHDKELNRPLKEAKESLKTTIKQHKAIENKRKKDKQVGALQAQYEQLQMETDQRIADVEQKEKVHMSRIMVEERVWYSTLINAFMTVLDQLVTVGSDFERLPNLMTELKDSSSSPSILPEAKRDFIEEWQIPSIHSPKLRAGSTNVNNYSLSTTNIPRMDSAQSFDSSELNISAPIMPVATPPLQQEPTPSLAGYTQNPPSTSLPPPPPPPSMSSYPSSVPEDHYDVPVLAPHVSVSPSQVSLVSNGSHNSSESTASSTRSASPQLTRSTVPPVHHNHYSSPATNSTLPTYPSSQTTHPSSTQYQQQQTSAAVYQSPVHHYHHLQHNQTDLPFVNRSDMTPSAMKYIPATLPRPRKDSNNSQPTRPKPNRNMIHAQQSLQHQNYQRPPPPLVKQSSLPEQDKDGDNEGEEGLSAFALALKQKKLRKTVHGNDRSSPRI